MVLTGAEDSIMSGVGKDLCPPGMTNLCDARYDQVCLPCACCVGLGCQMCTNGSYEDETVCKTEAMGSDIKSGRCYPDTGFKNTVPQVAQWLGGLSAILVVAVIGFFVYGRTLEDKGGQLLPVDADGFQQLPADAPQ